MCLFCVLETGFIESITKCPHTRKLVIATNSLNPPIVLGSNMTHFQKVTISEIWLSFYQIVTQKNNVVRLFTSKINNHFTTSIESGSFIQCYSI